MVIVQPISEFGSSLCKELDAHEAGPRQWQSFEFAVAWINRLGAGKIKHPATQFLNSGGSIRATVGLDFGSTSYEGLGALLDLGDLKDGDADITTHVFFDENPACTFHPKVYLFSNLTQGRLFVGSNNMTWAGLSTNVEAALEVTGDLTEQSISVARETLAAWRDASRDPRIRILTRDFLEELREQNYVRTEQQIRSDRIRSRHESASRSRTPLFGRSPSRNTPRGEGGKTEPNEQASNSSYREVLLMRVRPRRDGKQLQISMSVLEGFMRGETRVVSTSGEWREIGYNMANGIRNTARFEAPEMERMQNPVCRFQWVEGGHHEDEHGEVLQFEVFDADSGGEGAEIFKTLQEGIDRHPVTDLAKMPQGGTVLSKSSRNVAQWYRVIRIARI